MQARTRSIRILLLAAIASVFLPFAVAGHPPKPPKKETKIFNISGSKQWLNTGIRLRPQDRVTIKATGKVCFSNGEKPSCVDPTGWNVRDYGNSWPYNHNYCDDPEKGLNHAALIANVGNPNFLVGRRLVFSGKNGTLYIGINDCTMTGEFGNTGSFSVTVTIERDVVPQR